MSWVSFYIPCFQFYHVQNIHACSFVFSMAVRVFHIPAPLSRVSMQFAVSDCLYTFIKYVKSICFNCN